MFKTLLHGLWFLVKWFLILMWYITKFTFKYFIIPAACIPVFLIVGLARLAGLTICSPFTIIEKLIPSIR